mmetsp:Transcript_3294/g.4868  ORF Transcript_3294/g.4868 Transcript_3294/m.4868 type:complete len:111 (+) Transcript_3294:157-489(+)
MLNESEEVNEPIYPNDSIETRKESNRKMSILSTLCYCFADHRVWGEQILSIALSFILIIILTIIIGIFYIDATNIGLIIIIWAWIIGVAIIFYGATLKLNYSIQSNRKVV